MIQTKLIEDQAAPILRVGFKVERTLSREPNACEIQIYNLNKDHRSKFQKKEIPITLEVGYVGNIFQIFSGNLSKAQNRLDGRDWVTTIQVGDGNTEFRSARINQSIKGPAKIGDVLKAAAESFGLDLGNVSEKASQGSIRGKISEFVNGIVLSGKSEQQLDKVLKPMGYTWSIQDGEIQLLGPNETIGNTVALLTSSTGMIGTPEAGENGFVKTRALIQRDLSPGYRFKIESRNIEVNGFYRVEKSTYVGDTWGGEWYVDIEGKPL
jgi:hypothetical protein